MGETSVFALKNKMRGSVFVFIAAVIIGAQAGCEWYRNCGACVADSGCGWCSNDPAGVGSGSVASTMAHDTHGKTITATNNEGTQGRIDTIRSDSVSENGVAADW